MTPPAPLDDIERILLEDMPHTKVGVCFTGLMVSDAKAKLIGNDLGASFVAGTPFWLVINFNRKPKGKPPILRVPSHRFEIPPLDIVLKTQHWQCFLGSPKGFVIACDVSG